MELEDIKSGAEYAQILIDHIIEGEKELPTEEQLPINLLTYWCEEIEIQADKAWVDYISGKREHFTFDEDEYTCIFRNYIPEIIHYTIQRIVKNSIAYSIEKSLYVEET